MKKFIIVGGGTAGWITALMAKQAFQDSEVSVIESSKLGILGAGEGSTPHIIRVMDYLKIPVSDLVKNTSSTIKNGILFSGWNQGGEDYLHGFGVFDNELGKYAFNRVGFSEWTDAPAQDYLASYKNIHANDIDFATMASLQDKTLFSVNPRVDKVSNPILNFKAHAPFSLHFDARSLAKFLSKVAVSRGIKKIDAIVNEVKKNQFGDISTITLDNDTVIAGDFFFDCTGFRKLLIGKSYESEWISFKESLPAKRAMPFFLKNDKQKIPPYTLAKAMSHGWIWQIPLQHRHGCGYVYDPDRISDEDVKKEIDLFAQEDAEIPTIFNFDPGYHKEVWVKNCLAVGLANGFVEPLEATSILQSILLLERFFVAKHKIFNREQVHIDYFNKDTEDEHQDVAAFIYLHYITNKTNNDFWKNFTKDYKMPSKLPEIYERLRHSLVWQRQNFEIFSVENYLTIMNGNHIFDKQEINNIFDNIIANTNGETQLKQIINKRKIFSKQLTDHNAFLKYLGADFNQEK